MCTCKKHEENNHRHYLKFLCSCLLQIVLECVRMEGHWMKETVPVTV